MGVEAPVPLGAVGRSTVAELLALRERVVPRGIATANPTVITSAEGTTWTDADGAAWIDFSGGIGTLNVGARHPHVTAALHRQVDELHHTCSHVAWHVPYLQLAARLAGLVPVDPPVKVQLCSIGSEAVENAVKIARSATGRELVVAFEGAFHGRTYMALTLTGKDRPYKQGVGPLVPGVRRVHYASCFRCPVGQHYPECGVACLDSLRELLTREGESVAAVIVEPVLGEGGFVVPPPEFLPMVAEMTRAAGALLIVDEVQTGMGRTGRLFASEHTGVRPDMILLGKSLADGLPLAAIAGRAEIMDAPPPGVLGGTYPGNPLACAAALAVLDVFDDGSLLERAGELGARAMTAMQRWQEEHARIGDVRGLGAMVAMELCEPDGSPAPAFTLALQAACSRRHLLTIRAGMYDNVVRLHFPLTIDDETFTRGLRLLEEALVETVHAHRTDSAEVAATTARQKPEEE